MTASAAPAPALDADVPASASANALTSVAASSDAAPCDAASATAATAASASPAPRPRYHHYASSTEIEEAFPHITPIIRRGMWMVYEHSAVNEFVGRLGDYRSGSFNGICTYRFTQAEHAAAFSEYAFEQRLHRLHANRTHGATREEVALEWERIEAEHDEILAWGRTTGMLREVVQHYRFERHTGAWSWPAHLAAGALVEKKHPTVPDPVNRAGVMIVWAEKEHRAWFWRGCRGTPLL